MNILKERKGRIMPIQFGFECHDGWYYLIDNLMGSIQKHIKSNCPDKPLPDPGDTIGMIINDVPIHMGDHNKREIKKILKKVLKYLED